MGCRVVAIIPAYNEAETVQAVACVAVSSPLVDEVIVVSDASEDATVREARCAGVRVVELFARHGKGGALRAGVEESRADVLLFLDADLRGLTVDHVNALVEPVINGKDAMTVGLRDRGWISRFLMPHLELVSGERALRRDIFDAVPDAHLRGYMIETSLNYYCCSHGLSYRAIFMPGLHIRTKFQKVGVLVALRQYGKMWLQVGLAMLIVRAERALSLFHD